MNELKNEIETEIDEGELEERREKVAEVESKLEQLRNSEYADKVEDIIGRRLGKMRDRFSGRAENFAMWKLLNGEKFDIKAQDFDFSPVEYSVEGFIFNLYKKFFPESWEKKAKKIRKQTDELLEKDENGGIRKKINAFAGGLKNKYPDAGEYYAYHAITFSDADIGDCPDYDFPGEDSVEQKINDLYEEYFGKEEGGGGENKEETSGEK
ncbi:MAG: hypothetical protein WC619_03485 [Patescibacteria group bacterium]